MENIGLLNKLGIGKYLKKVKEYVDENIQYIETTYDNLVNLRNNSQLIPGQQYRITDYVTTTVQENTQSAGHQFDIIVTADDEKTLNEVARACLHEGDTYFTEAGAKLEAWQIWYCLDNDTERFAWAIDFAFLRSGQVYTWNGNDNDSSDYLMYEWESADGSMICTKTLTPQIGEACYDDTGVEDGVVEDIIKGTGVIYRMIDEWNNDCPYDFKNIQFIRYELNAPETVDTEPWLAQLSLNIQEQFSANALPYIWGGVIRGKNRYWKYDHVSIYSTVTGNQKAYYTFSTVIDDIVTDHSLLQGYCYDNTIKEYINSQKQRLNNNIFYEANGHKCHSNFLGNHCSYNSFGHSCFSNSFENHCSYNSFGNYFRYSSFGNDCYSNSFGKECYYNSFGNYFQNNSFGNYCHYNSFGNNCYDNSFGNECHSNSLRNQCYSNNFGNECHSNSLRNQCYSNNFGNECHSNSLRNQCYSNNFGNECNDNSFGNGCFDIFFGNSCDFNSFGDSCNFNSFRDNCDGNSFGNSCTRNSFESSCYYNSFGNSCDSNIFANDCQLNSFGNNCYGNRFGNECYNNSFGNFNCDNYFRTECYNNSFGNNCYSNFFGNRCNSNSFGNDCQLNSFRVSAGKSATLKDYVKYNHFDDGCCYNVIWNSDTTSSSKKLQNINVNRGVCGTSSSYNYINIDTLNSEKEININNYNWHIYIDYGDTFKVTYDELFNLALYRRLIPNRQYRIIDYVTTTSQNNTRSAGHPFDIIVTALDEYTLSKEAQAVRNINDDYFDRSNLSAWKIWYSIDNDTNRFGWAGNEITSFEEVEVTTYDSSECTINPELIDGNSFITPFNFVSCVWVDGNGDGAVMYDGDSNHDEAELVYEWGYFTDENDNTQLCLYKSDSGLYEEEGQPDYGDKYLYRGVITVDDTDYDYWQKWDANPGSINVNETGDYVYATTDRIVSNPEAYLFETTNKTVETVIQLNPKGVIYRMIDEFNNDCPYDFKNIQFTHPNDTTTYPDYYYTFSTVIDGVVTDHSMTRGYCYGNTIKECIFEKQYLNSNIFLNTLTTGGCYNNSFGNKCRNNSFGTYCYNNSFRDDCGNNSFRNHCKYNSFGNSCSSNSFGYDCWNNSFGDDCGNNSFGNDCNNNSFGNRCHNNSAGNYCKFNSFGNGCWYNSFRVSADKTAPVMDYVERNHIDDGCDYNVIWNSDTTSNIMPLKNININRGICGTQSSDNIIFNMINIDTLNADYEIQVAKNSAGEIKIYCEADLIA